MSNVMFGRNHRYCNRINHVLNFAHIHFGKELNLDLLANEACLSKYHFTRVFNDQVGETPITFLRRIRLETAAYLLSYKRNLRVNDIALNCGFSSNQTFSRSFAEKFGHSPTEFRTCCVYSLENCLGTSAFDGYLGSTQVFNFDQSQIRVEEKSPIKVAYVRNIGSYGGDDGIDSAIRSIIRWAKANGFYSNSTEILGTSWDTTHVTPKTSCRYDACIQVPMKFPMNADGISVQIIPGGHYAVMRASYQQPEDLPIIWDYFGRALRTTSRFEHYPVGMLGPCYEIFRTTQRDGYLEAELYHHLPS